MTVKYRIKNWKEFQHYKDRNPPWIKLHFAILSSKDWVTLDDKSRVLAIASMLIGSKSEGEIDGSEAGLEYLQRVAYLHSKPNLKPLIDCGFLECASGVLADASNIQANVRPEERRGETETETEKTDVVLPPDVLPPEGEKPESHVKSAKEVLQFLNEKTGRNYQPVSANIDLIVARLKDGSTPLDLRQVIAKKCREWSGDEKMAQYLRPATLFNRTKFAQYAGELGAQ